MGLIMVESEHLQNSRKVIAAILASLWDRGIQDGLYSFSDIELPDDFEQYFDACFLWLLDEGIIRAGDTQQYVSGEPMSVVRPALTSKGFSILEAEDPTSQKAIGDRLVAAGKDIGGIAGSAAVVAIVGEIVGHAAGAFARSQG